MIPYAQPHIDRADRKAVDNVLHGTVLTQGRIVKEFEGAICDYTGAKYAVTFNSGTSALHTAYLAVDLLRKRNGWEVTPIVAMNPITFVATSNMAKAAGYGVAFADDKEGWFNWVSMHYAGRYADPGLIEDACHALGSDSPHGKVGNCGGGTKITVFSTHAIKCVTTGEGGICTTNDPLLATKMKYIRSHGRNPISGKMEVMGYNYRMTDIQAALGLSQLSKIDKFMQQRQYVFDYYSTELKGYARLPEPGVSPTMWHLYAVNFDTTEQRDHVKDYLARNGIGTQIHYRPVYLEPYYQGLGFEEGSCPKAEGFWRTELSLPMHTKLSKSDLKYICNNVKEAIG